MALCRSGAPALPPISVVEVDLAQPLPAITSPHESGRYTTVRVLVRLHGEPLGLLQLPMASCCDRSTLASEIEAAFKSDIDRHLDDDGLSPTALPFRSGSSDEAESNFRCRTDNNAGTLVSIVIPTIGRTSLDECLQSILASTHHNLEVIVVDNAPWNPLTNDLVRRMQAADARLRYEVEPVSGCSKARNVGLRAARGPVVAFTDDDVVVDTMWLQGLLRGFQRTEKVVAVIGLTVPQRLETPAEIVFEVHRGFGRGFRHRLWDRDVHTGTSLLYPYGGLSGASNNLAILKDAALSNGGFDERLGPGTPTYASEDKDLILSMVRQGHQVSYEPSAIVHHAHRSDWEGLKWQVFTYSIGRTALLLKWALADRQTARFLIERVPRVLFQPSVRRARRQRRAQEVVSVTAVPSSKQPRCLVFLDSLGLLFGPAAYLRAASRSRRRPA